VHRFIIVACALVLAGCGSTTARHETKAPSQTGRMKTIVRAWSKDLNKGDNAALARLFAVPVLMTQGPYVYRLVNRSQVARWHAALPCAGHVVSIQVHGRFATAVFRLGNRATSRCDAPGTLAYARFTIVRGKIVAWQQLPPPAHTAGPVA
jgi:hypothetical protein